MNQKLRVLQLIHIALCMGLCVAYMVLAYVFEIDPLALPEITAENAMYLAIPIGFPVLAQFLFKSQLKGIDPKLPLNEKLTPYTVASIMRWALLEIGALATLVLAPSFFLLGLLLVIYIAWLRPTPFRMEGDLVRL